MIARLNPDSMRARCRQYLGAQDGRWVASAELAQATGHPVGDLTSSLRGDVRAGRIERQGAGRNGVQWRAEPVDADEVRSLAPDWPPGWRETVRDALRGRA